MDRFERLIAAIQLYENDSCGMKATAHHSAVSVRVAEMEAALGDTNGQKAVGDADDQRR
jgi:hypothetical protein